MNPGTTYLPAASMTRAACGAFEFSDRRDAPVQDADVGREPRIAGAVHDAAVADQQIETLSRLRANDCEQNAERRRPIRAQPAIS